MSPGEEVAANRPPAASEDGPASIARFGSFYAGGRQIRISDEPVRRIAFTDSASMDYDPNGLFHIEQAYVQYFVPSRRHSRLPLVMLHGGGMTGTMWEQTPDGRPGWAQGFIGSGFCVNVVDNIERGRAGWAPFPGVWAGDPIVRSAEESWSLFRFGKAENFPARQPFNRLRFPIGYLDEFIMGAVPRWLSNNPTAVDTFAAVLDRIGPCIVMAHSHSGEVALRAAQARPELVQAMVLVEPSGFADASQLSWARDKPVLWVYGDYLDATPLWCALMDKAARFKSALDAAGARSEWWELPEMGIRGNSHMLMMDDNNDAIASRISAWLLSHCGHFVAGDS